MLTANFDAAPQTVNFQSHPAAAVRQINEWVSGNTDGLIPSILASVPETTRLILANAVYLHAYWAGQFEKEDVSTGTFHGPGAGAPVPFMHQTERLPYGAGDGYQAVELPYRSSTLSLMVLLPTGRSLASLQNELSVALLSRITAHMKPAEVELALPKFHIELSMGLDAVLSSLGMPLAFGQEADFSGIDAAENLAISRVLHAADIEVQEAGTLAAAATIVEIEPSAMKIEPHGKPFDANHPFLYLLRDERTGAVLFAGRLVNAAGAQS